MRDLFDLAASAQRTAAALPQANRNGVFKASMLTKTLILQQIVGAIGADRRLSHLKRGGPLGVGFDVKGTTNAVSIIRARGFYFAWVERGTRPHLITPRGQRAMKRSGAKALLINGHFRAHAMHPGTPGKYPFRKGVDLARPLTPSIFQNEVRKAVVRSW